MEPIDAIEPVSRAREVDALGPVADIDWDRSDDLTAGPVDQPFATWASMPTTFDPYPAVLDPAAAWFAAAASAQNLKVFSMGLPPRDRKRR